MEAGPLGSFWPWAAQHVAFARNILDVNGKESAYARRFSKGPFPGLLIPFMARIRFKQYVTIEKAKDTDKMQPIYVWGVFLGWGQRPGGE